MQTTVKPSTVRALAELEREMISAQRTADAEAIREALAVLVRPSRGWLSTGQAAERLGITTPTVKDWIRRGTLVGQRVGSRWWVAEESVDKVLKVREMLSSMEEEGYPSDEEILRLTKRARRQMALEEARRIG